jgi:hypothetical protein
VFDYDGGEVGLIAVLPTDMIFDPGGGYWRLRFEKENTAVVFYEEIYLGNWFHGFSFFGKPVSHFA